MKMQVGIVLLKLWASLNLYMEERLERNIAKCQLWWHVLSFFKFILFLVTMHGLFIVLESRGYSAVAVHGLLIALASLVAEHRL